MARGAFAGGAGPSGFFDGTLGCPNIGADQAEGCYRIQPDVIARLAVIPVGHTTLLALGPHEQGQPRRGILRDVRKDAQERSIPLTSALPVSQQGRRLDEIRDVAAMSW